MRYLYSKHIIMDISKYSTGIQHVGVPTNDIEASVKFYESLGFKLVHSVNNNGEEVRFLQMGNLMIETYQNFQAALVNGAVDHIALDVKNIEALYEEVKAAGYKLLDSHINDLPFWQNGIRYFIIEGPNHEKVEFCEIL